MTNGDHWLSDYVTDDGDGLDGRRYNVLAMIVNDVANWCWRTNESNIESITPWVQCYQFIYKFTNYIIQLSYDKQSFISLALWKF